LNFTGFFTLSSFIYQSNLSKKQSRHVKVTKNHEELTQESDPDLNNQWKKYFSEQPCDCRKQTKDEL